MTQKSFGIISVAPTATRFVTKKVFEKLSVTETPVQGQDFWKKTSKDGIERKIPSKDEIFEKIQSKDGIKRKIPSKDEIFEKIRSKDGI